MGQVAVAQEELDDRHGSGVERAAGGPVAFFVSREEIRPAVVDGPPERGGAGSTGLGDRWHKDCTWEQIACPARRSGENPP